MALFDGFFSAVLSRLRTFTQKKVLALVCSVCGILLFLPDRFLGKLHLVGIRDNYGQWLGLAFLVSGLMFGYKCIADILAWNKRRKLYCDKDACRRIAALDERSLGYLLALYETQGRSWTFDLADASINILSRERMVLQCKGGVLDKTKGRVFYEFYLQHWVVAFLDKNAEAYEAFKRKLDSYDLSTDTILPDIPF